MKLLLRFFGWIFAVGTVVFLVGVAGAAGLFWHFSKDLPDYSQLQDYEPPVMTRVHAGDGSLLAEYATQRRLYLPIQAIPKLVFPGGAPFVPSQYGQKYLHGLVRAPETLVYVSRGLGTSGLPVRFCSRPEINLITLTPG